MKKLLEIFDLEVIFEDRKNNLKRTILVCILFPFFIFYLQQLKPHFKLRPLQGYFIPTATYSKPTVASWFSGDYQVNTNNFVNENFGFRNFFVRLNNELRFRFFKKAQAAGVIIGKENYLYEVGYIETYYGKFFMGPEALSDTTNNLKFLQDTLKTIGKELLIVIAPSKARVYPEYIPDYFVKEGDINTNYKFLTENFKRVGLQFIDFNALFLQKKKTSEYPLFPQLGIHWSRLEAARAADTIINYLSWVSNTDLPRIKIKDVKVLDTLQAPDNDIIEGMNILFMPPHPKMAYPSVVEIDKKNKAKRNLMVVADSYWWDIYSRDIPKNVFDNNEFWYYNNELFGNNYAGKTDTKSVDLKRHILRSDYIILMCTESNLSRLGFGFIGNAIKAFRTPITPTQQELNDIKALIKTNKEWYEQIQVKAKENKLNVDSMMTLDAEWYFQRHGPQKQEMTLEEIKASIKLTPSWMKEVIAKATEKKISVDSMMTEDALWYMANVVNSSPNKKALLTVSSVKENILHNNEWMGQIREKAKKRGLSVDSMMTLDALWFIENHK